MKDVGMMNSLSSSCNNEERPKLENFLGVGGHTFADQLQEHKNKLCNYNHLNNGYDHNTSTYTTMYQQTSTDHHHHHEQAQHPNNDINGGAGNNSSTIGLSMIKNWLRNNPSAPAPLDNKVAGPPPPPPAASQTLSLSMSTGSQSSSTLPLLNANATTESCTSDGKLDAQTGGAIESVPRKSIDTFGQRTSIYRGVTRLINLISYLSLSLCCCCMEVMDG